MEAERRKRLNALKEAASYTGEDYDLYEELTKEDPNEWIGRQVINHLTLLQGEDK